MKRSLKTFATLSAGMITLLTAAPAYAQYYDDAAGAGFSFLFCGCYGIFILLGIALTVLWVWMLVDAIARQEYEYPPGAGSKVLWIVLIIVFGWITAAIYYFMVYKKVKRGTVKPPWAQQQPGAAPQAAPPTQPAAPPPPPPGPTSQPPAAPPQAQPPAAPPQEPPATPPAPPAPPEGGGQD